MKIAIVIGMKLLPENPVFYLFSSSDFRFSETHFQVLHFKPVVLFRI